MHQSTHALRARLANRYALRQRFMHGVGRQDVRGDDVKESDWKVFRSLKETLLERFCQLTLAAAGQIIEDQKKSQYARYLDLYTLVEKNDKALAQVFDGVSRSNALGRLAFMRSGGLFTDDEFARFSSETQDQINRIVKQVEDE
jgi:hypothetical protein